MRPRKKKSAVVYHEFFFSALVGDINPGCLMRIEPPNKISMSYYVFIPRGGFYLFTLACTRRNERLVSKIYEIRAEGTTGIRNEALTATRVFFFPKDKSYATGEREPLYFSLPKVVFWLACYLVSSRASKSASACINITGRPCIIEDLPGESPE